MDIPVRFFFLSFLLPFFLLMGTVLFSSDAFAERGIEDVLSEGGYYAAPKNIPTLGGTVASPEEKVNSIVYSAIKILLSVSGLVSVFFVLLGGVRYTMSAGDDDMINGAKTMILYALVGLLVVIFSYAILTNIIHVAEITE